MSRSIYFLIFLSLIAVRASSQVLVFPYTAATVTADGMLTPAEWQQSNRVKIGISAVDSVEVWYQYSANAMHFAFMGKLESSNMLFPELLIDPQYEHSSAWTSNQWWFHVSATDCEHSGGYGVYTNCQATQSGWQGAPNFASGAPITDTVEIVIPFAKPGFAGVPQDTIGISFLVTNTASIFKMYPGAADRQVPSSWAKAVFQQATSVGSEVKAGVLLFPNPVKDELHVTLSGPSRVSVCDMLGRVIFEAMANSGDLVIPFEGAGSGRYLVRIVSSDGARSYETFVKD